MAKFKRNNEVRALYKKLHTDKIKIVAGLRQCGKTYLLDTLFFEYVKNKKYADDETFIKIYMFSTHSKYKTKAAFLSFIKSKITEKTKIIFIDEVQEIENYVDVLVHLADEYKNIDFYVTGSNSNTLSNDIVDGFKEHADTLFLQPLSFKEIKKCKKKYTLDSYLKYGGIPYIVNSTDKTGEIKKLYNEVFRLDIIDRVKKENYRILSEDDCKAMLENIFSSCTAFSTNEFIQKISKKTGATVEEKLLIRKEIKDYLKILQQSFLIIDIDNEDYLKQTPLEKLGINKKYYSCDCGIAYQFCNVPIHKLPVALETAIYLKTKESHENPKCLLFIDEHGNNREIDFSFGNNLIQVAYRLSDENRENELNVFKKFNNNYRKQLIYVDNVTDENEKDLDYISAEDYLLS